MSEKKNKNGPGMSEIILALIVMIVLGLIFKEQLAEWFSSIVRRRLTWQ